MRLLVRIVAELILAPVRLYRLVISPALGPRCRYSPSCSQYAIDAVLRRGPIVGPILTAWRVLRCNPWSPGGWDPVQERPAARSHRSQRRRECCNDL